jgi:hypothetical protein
MNILLVGDKEKIIEKVCKPGYPIVELAGRIKTEEGEWDIEDIVNQLLTEGRTILTNASKDRFGRMLVSTIAGFTIYTNNREYPSERKPRTFILWEEAFLYLNKQNLVKMAGEKDNRKIYFITKSGFELSDELAVRKPA